MCSLGSNFADVEVVSDLAPHEHVFEESHQIIFQT